MTQEEQLQFSTLEHILETGDLTPFYQPIVSLAGQQIFGYEAVIRGPSDSLLHSPINLFDAANRHGRLAELDLLCREKAIYKFGTFGLNNKLFINTTPSTILQKDYPHGLTLQYLKQAGLEASNIIIELTEQYPIDDYELMRAATEHYREMGFSIAIDDLGAGYAGLRTWSELKPDYVKLDRHFMQNIHEDRQKRQFVQSMIDIAQSIGCQIIGEGIEIRQEYLTAQGLDMQLAQGYYFGRPTKIPLQQLEQKLFAQRQPNPCKNTGRPRANSLVSSLLTDLTPIYVHDTTEQAAERFRKHPKLAALPVTDQAGRVAGIVWRDEFLTLYASRFGRELHGRKPIKLFMDVQPIVAETALPLNKLSYQITNQESPYQHSVFIITEQGFYRGVGSLLDLLRQITDMQINMARHANPLTGLPGNVPLSEQIRDILEQQRDVSICYFDLDNFKPYNDIYGYSRGDQIINLTAQLLTEHCDVDIDFVGHVGGDDFIVLFESEDWRERCDRILAAFSTLSSSLYNLRHQQQQGIHAIDRYGKETFYPLITLSIGAVSLRDYHSIQTEQDLAECASKAKSLAKKVVGNCLYQLTEQDLAAATRPVLVRSV